MTHVITGLCVRDNSCIQVCPVDCISPGTPADRWPTFYIDPQTCIDCGACIPECPYGAIFRDDEVPSAFQAKGGELLNDLRNAGHAEVMNHLGEQVVLEHARALEAGEVVDLTASVRLNAEFYG